jgi:dynein heavy chain
MQRFKETLLQVNNLVPDTYFDSFTRFTIKMWIKLSYFNVYHLRPIINRKFEEKTCGEGPKLMIMFDDDQHLKNLEAKCRECLNAAFNAAQQYADTFQPFRVFYRDNETTDVEKIRTDEHSKFFTK